MKTLKDVIAKLTADQKRNDYDLVEILEEKLGDYQIDTFQVMSDHNVLDVLDYDGRLHEVIDSAIDMRSYDLRVWACDNWHFIEEAVEEGLTECVTDYHQLIQIGQYIYHRQTCYRALSDLIDTLQGTISGFLDS